jgi:hypothetical protein
MPDLPDLRRPAPHTPTSASVARTLDRARRTIEDTDRVLDDTRRVLERTRAIVERLPRKQT